MKIRPSKAKPMVTMAPPERTMEDEEFAQWLSQRPSAWGKNLSIIDGFVTSVVVGPVSMDPLEWICPLLGIEPTAFNTGGTPEFAAIKAIMRWHNRISDTLRDDQGLKPVFRTDAKAQITAHDWCAGFMLAVDMNPRLWNDVLKTNSPHRYLMMPILMHLPVRLKGKMVTIDEPSILDDCRADIPGNAARLRKIFQFKRFGTPHPNAPRP